MLHKLRVTSTIRVVVRDEWHGAYNSQFNVIRLGPGDILVKHFLVLSHAFAFVQRTKLRLDVLRRVWIHATSKHACFVCKQRSQTKA